VWKKINLLEKERVTNNCLLRDKDNTINLLERENVCKKKIIDGLKCGYNRRNMCKIHSLNLALLFQNDTWKITSEYLWGVLD